MYNQSSKNERQYQGINRTVCIGLGGTGKDVLMRIRRLIVDRYKDLANLPVVSFVHIDTDKEATQSGSLRTGNTYQGSDLGFQDAEKVNATMTATQISELVQGLEQCHSNRHQPSPYEHIARWFPPQLLQNIKAIDQGAKGIRPVGRLAFFHNYLKIKQAIENAEQRTRGHEQELLRKFGLIVDPGLNIVVVGSLCGGTGSGTFLDMAYSLRHAYPDVKQLIGYLVISPDLYGNTPNMCANTYAALMELDYYSSSGTQFDACYDQRYLTIVQEKRPPFDYTYLVGKSTEQGNYVIDKQRKLCNVIAHKIALDFSSELAPVVKGMRDNFAQHLIQEDDHPRPNCQRYLTFGLAAIYFPRDRISLSTVTRMNFRLVNFWLQGEGQNPDPLKLSEQFFIEYRWHNNLEQKDGLVMRLESVAIDADKAFTSVMKAWITKQENSIAECKTKDDRASLMRQLQREFKEQFHKVKSGETESTRGTWLTKVLKARANLITQLCQDIDSYLSKLLAPSDRYFSIANARNWLDCLQTELSNYQYDIESKISKLNSPRSLEELEKKWTQSDRTIQDIEEEFKLLSLGNKNNRIQDEARKAVKETETAIKHNFNLAIALEALEIIKALQQYTQNRIGQLTNFYRIVDELKIYYEKQQATLKQSNSDEMSGEEIFEDEDINSCYEALLPASEYRNQVVKVSQEIIASVGEAPSLTVLLDNTNSELLKQEINSTVNRLFGTRSTNSVQSAIKRFNQKYPFSERAVRFNQILREAQPLLPLNLTTPYFHNNSAKKSQIIGFKDTDDLDVKQFYSVLTEKLAVPDHVIKPTQADDKVLIVTEYAAFSLRLIDGLKQLQDHYYLQKKHSSNNTLHNDRGNIFTDIIPPPVLQMQELQDIFYPCLAFNLIEQNSNTQQLEFQYYDDLRGVYYTASLSYAWKQALQDLVDNPNMARALKERLDEAIVDIKNQPAKWEQYYLPQLRKFVERVDSLSDTHINYSYKSRVVGSRGTDVNSPQAGVINRFLARMQAEIKIGSSEKKLPTSTNNQNILSGELVEDTTSDYSDNRSKRRIELEKLKQDLDMGVINSEEYEYERQEIMNRFPLRK